MKLLKIAIVSAIIGIGVVTSVVASDDDGEYKYNKKYSKNYGGKYSVMPVTNQLYKDECASCHFGYQAGLLPKRSWIKLMEPKELENHFGDDATIDEQDRLTLLSYLVTNAADSKMNNSRLSKKIVKKLPRYSTPIALSQTRWFKKDHDEIPARLVKQEDVKSIANCAACHTKAEKGRYGEREIMIPNYGRWDD